MIDLRTRALYAFAAVCHRPVVCFAHVTNTMGVGEGDFEKGPADGALQALQVLGAVTRAWSPYRQQKEHVNPQS
ncbi:MAG TPA: hypothetical protein VGR29_01925 [Thermomicrobiales bacterium]|nr:hypothetical protein [Thermomicrobiales bacterium]